MPIDDFPGSTGDAWSNYSVTDDAECVFSDTLEMCISAELQLRIIDCALPGLSRLPPKERVLVGADFCRYVQARLARMCPYLVRTQSSPNIQRIPFVKSSVRTSESEGSRTSAASGGTENDSQITLDIPENTVPHSHGTPTIPIPDEPFPVNQKNGVNTDHGSPCEPPIPARISRQSEPEIPPRPSNLWRNTGRQIAEIADSRNTKTESLSASKSQAEVDGMLVDEGNDFVLPSAEEKIDESQSLEPTTLSGPGPVPRPDSQMPEKTEPVPLEVAVERFIRVVTAFSTAFVNKDDLSIEDYSTANPDILPHNVLSFLSIWLGLHYLLRPFPLWTPYLSIPAPLILQRARALPIPIDWDDPNGTAGGYAAKPEHEFTKSFGQGLVKVAGLKFVRTRDITSHLYFDRIRRLVYIYVTAGVCLSANHGTHALNYVEPKKLKGDIYYGTYTGMPHQFTAELSRTFSILFDMNSGSRKVFRDFQKTIPDLKPLIPSMRVRGRKIGEVWTYHGNDFYEGKRGVPNRDPIVEMQLRYFPYFGERLLILEKYLNDAKPSSFRQVLRDSRDHLQYYTFLTAFIVFIVTIVGLILSILQTVASFWQVQLALKSSGS